MLLFHKIHPVKGHLYFSLKTTKTAVAVSLNTKFVRVGYTALTNVLT